MLLQDHGGDTTSAMTAARPSVVRQRRPACGFIPLDSAKTKLTAKVSVSRPITTSTGKRQYVFRVHARRRRHGKLGPSMSAT